MIQRGRVVGVILAAVARRHQLEFIASLLARVAKLLGARLCVHGPPIERERGRRTMKNGLAELIEQFRFGRLHLINPIPIAYANPLDSTRLIVSAGFLFVVTRGLDRNCRCMLLLARVCGRAHAGRALLTRG